MLQIILLRRDKDNNMRASLFKYTWKVLPGLVAEADMTAMFERYAVRHMSRQGIGEIRLA